MQQYKTITKQILFNYIIKALDFGLMFLLFMVLTRVLSVSDFGIYSILSVTILLLSGILRFGLDEFLVRDVAGKRGKIKIKKFSILFKFLFLSSIVIIGLILIFNLPLLKLFHLQEISFSFKMVLLIIFCLTLSLFINNGYYQAKKEMNKVIFFDFLLKSLWALPVIIMVLFYSIDLNKLFLLRFLVIFIIFLLLIFLMKKNKASFFIPLNRNYIKKGLTFGGPIIFLIISQLVITASDRYILGFFHGSIKVSLYSYIYSLLNFVLVISYTIAMIFYPYIVEAWNQKKKEKSNFLFNAYFKYSLMICLPCTIGLFILRKELITMISGPKYLLALPIFPILMFFPLLDMGTILYQKTLLIKNKTATISIIYLIGMSLNIILNFLLIPKYHFYGAAIATIITYIVIFSIFFIKARNNIQFDFSFTRLKGILISVVIMGIVISFIHPKIYLTKIFTIILGIFVYLIALFITKSFVKEELVFIKSLIKRNL